jgi:drug/metabolite transporter (DMT)-like permease
MKKFLAFIAKALSGPGGEISSKRVYSGLLIISGVVLAFLKGDSGNVQTLVFGGCALLGAGAFAERIGVATNTVKNKNEDMED